MAVYAIGDIQGCYDDLMGLLEEIHFDSAKDRLWFTGDLVNRGPDSLRVLRFVRDLGNAAVTVLGNHDLHLLALAEGHAPHHRSDTLDAILDAPDREELLAWLRQQPLLYHDEKLHFTMVHAGLPPQWNLALAQQCASEVETVLRGENYLGFLANMYGNEPDIWDENLQGWERLRFITNCFSRLRYCNDEGRLCLKSKGEPGTQPDGYRPWYEIPDRKSSDIRIIFGHWSTLGLFRTQNIFSLDTGCLWGGLLTAMHLESDMSIYSYQCPGHQRPKQ
ncbi:symmetrical bis(5'-nucleosyl)-tetraphosphatase [Kaarinaea lacus]